MLGLSVKELRKTMFEDTAVDDFTQTFYVNKTATYFTMLAFLELLDAGNKNALTGGFGKPLRKAGKAIAHLAKHASTGLAPQGIQINALAPGFFPSKMANVIIESTDPGTESGDNPNFIPARRFGEEEEM
ncbi:hypothetical protein G6011_02328 [Alternaria panax]|uniref:Uncharacterized protein n=1 Tax=Alternaria panax TaxID=48097 RepID=A0AAD4FFH5_9PLEO|nr:hypothetical protein G6011_02328 [Alternaria panax]